MPVWQLFMAVHRSSGWQHVFTAPEGLPPKTQTAIVFSPAAWRRGSFYEEAAPYPNESGLSSIYASPAIILCISRHIGKHRCSLAATCAIGVP